MTLFKTESTKIDDSELQCYVYCIISFIEYQYKEFKIKFREFSSYLYKEIIIFNINFLLLHKLRKQADETLIYVKRFTRSISNALKLSQNLNNYGRIQNEAWSSNNAINIQNLDNVESKDFIIGETMYILVR